MAIAPAEHPAEVIPTNRRFQRRKWALRCGAILFGISLFAATEGLCRTMGWGEPTRTDDPYVGFTAVHPLFVRNESGTRFEIPKSRFRFFAPDSFPVEKGPDTFRVFCIGGSTVQGRPFSTETSFPTWMKLGLAEADPEHHWEVVNCGGISYATYRLVPIVEECLEHEPDLIILCEGHNEFLEDRTYAHFKQSAPIARFAREAVGRSHVANLLRAAVTTSSPEVQNPDRTILPDDADALLNYKNGLRAYHRDPEWRAGIVEHFGHNLRRMIQMCRERQVPVLVVLPPSNLSDCAPFKSQHRDSLAEADLERWNRLRDAEHAATHQSPAKAVEILQEMISLDPEYAATHFEIGKCYEALGMHREARAAFVRARDLDICPLRMVSELEQSMRDVVDESGVPFLDAHELLEARSRNGVLGGPILCDRVHPSFEGNQWIADEIIRQMSQLGLLTLASGWDDRAKESYRRHFAALDAHYFLKGLRTIKAVESWARGETNGPSIEVRAPHRVRDSE
ncbi:MAG: SGNH/GDSL hydrolase family protein [Planctomycetaceae bacterium]